MKSVAFAVALAVSVPWNVLAQSASPVTKAFTDCLLSQAQKGSYTSSDGGRSAVLLMGECDAEWKAWHDQCMASGDTDGDCTLKAGTLAQSTLLLLGK